MSASFDIQSSTGPYSVTVDRGSFARLLQSFRNDAVIADAFFESKFVEAGASALFVEALEENKSLDASPALIERMRKSGANRSTHLVAVGGGIVQDLSAFIAAVYMRGLAWTYVPTTVLAMVDSCIGGKSSINVGPYKNLVGTFHSPQRVVIDPDVIATLPDEQRASGLIEAAKICFCRGEEAFAAHMSFQPAVDMPTENLEALIVNSLHAKQWFIERDEFDRSERLLLNFGHTFGHAIEGASHFAVAHGIGVGLGIECAIRFEQLRGVDYTNAPRVGRLQSHLQQMIRADARVAAALVSIKIDDVLEKLVSDKKHGANDYALILVAPDGRVELRRLPKSADTLDTVRRAVADTIVKFTDGPGTT